MFLFFHAYVFIHKQGLRHMDLFDQMEQEAQRLGKPLPDPMSFIRDIGANIDHGRGWSAVVLCLFYSSLFLS